MNRAPHNNLWAEKLQEVSLPDAGEAWKSMAAVLDKEMPIDQRNRRRWLLLLLFLFVLGGSGYLVWRGSGRPAAAAIPIVQSGSSTIEVRPSSAIEVHPSSPTTVHASSVNRVHSSSANRVHSSSAIGVQLSSADNLHPSSGNNVRPSFANSIHASFANNVHPSFERQEDSASPPISPADATVGRQMPSRSSPGPITSLGIAQPTVIGVRIKRPPAADPLKCPPVGKVEATGLMLGIGLNQSLPVDGQQLWTNPSGGLNHWWKDYIPVPFVRYYLRPKLFIQGELRFHAPQYLPKNSYFFYQYNDTLYSGVVFVKKLSYFQLPVTVHYVPAENWSIGLGLQYAHYGKGIAALTDSFGVTFYAFRPLGDYPMVFVRHNEFSGLVSVDYTYRRWIVGLSYDMAFAKSLSVRVPDQVATPQAEVIFSTGPVRNSSLQLSLRYILWDGRSKD
jgi:hypothetical protein